MPSVFSLVLNDTNVVPNSNNALYRYNFIGGNFKTKNARLCLSHVTIPYSWFNVSPQWSNQTLGIRWFTGSTFIDTTITFPTGFYSTADLNDYLKQYMISQNYFLANETGQYIFYIAIVQNQTYYANQLILTKIPTADEAEGLGLITPLGAPPLPLVSKSPLISFPASNSIGTTLGFANGTQYGGTTSNVSQLSTQTPLATNVNSLIIHCDLASNAVTMPSDIIDSIPIIDTAFGANINYSPSFERYVSITDGTYNSLLLTITDENNNNIIAQDNRSLFTLVLETE
jgi:hypothetical protein